MTHTAIRLRELLAEPGIVVAPGAYDGLTAKLVEAAGFHALYCTGGGISRSRGFPDLGYTTLTELLERIRNIVEVCPLPLIADADAGFGNVLTLTRAVRELERAGAAGLHIEDAEIPARFKDPAANLLPAEDMVRRIEAAMGARESSAFLIIARTDALPYEGLDAAIERAGRYAAAGAEMVYVEHLKTRAQMEQVAARVSAPKLVSINQGENELVPAGELAAMGYDLLTIPADAQLAAIHSMRALLAHLAKHGTTAGFDAVASFAERDALVETARARALLQKFLP